MAILERNGKKFERRILTGDEERVARFFLDSAAHLSLSSKCLKRHCGAAIVNPEYTTNDGVIGVGFNSPPGNLESQRRCRNSKKDYDEKVTDKTCCMHAEEIAIGQALMNHSKYLPGARMYFMRRNPTTEKIENSGEPYCTQCSKKALHYGIAEWVLQHKEGITLYDAETYNDISFAFTK